MNFLAKLLGICLSAKAAWSRALAMIAVAGAVLAPAAGIVVAPLAPSAAIVAAPAPAAAAAVATAAVLFLADGQDALAADEPAFVADTAPWVNVDRHFGAAIRTGRIVPITPNPAWKVGQTLADGGVYMVSGDWPGWTRSVDGGRRFESAVSGPVFSKNICGGYDAQWYGGSSVAQSGIVCVGQTNGACSANAGLSAPANINFGGQDQKCYTASSAEVSTCVACPPSLSTCSVCTPGGPEPAWCMACTGTTSDAAQVREWADVSPPSSTVAFHGATVASGRDVASGPAPASMGMADLDSQCRGPANEPGCAKDILYTSQDWWSFFSPDAGRSWFRMTPQCEMSQQVGFGAIAVDAGRGAGASNFGGHVVAAATNWLPETGPIPREACGAAPKLCQQRSIAWTDDVGPELRESMKGTMGGPDAWQAKSRTERAGGGGADLSGDVAGTAAGSWASKAKWRYASINHLPAPVAIGGTCKVIAAKSSDATGFDASVPPSTCEADQYSRCHGRKAQTKLDKLTPTSPVTTLDRDAWCLNYASDDCSCKDGAPSNCRYPNPNSAAIDPRNGWAYLSTDVGLLSSPSGGRRWIRQGGGPTSNPADVFQEMTSLDTFAPQNAVQGAKLYTKQFYCAAGETAAACAAADPSPANSLDLNSDPARIQAVSRVSIAFTPCGNGLLYKNGRQAGHLSASVAVSWTATVNGGTKPMSSVFVAAQRANCESSLPLDAPGALEFWDTAHMDVPATLSQFPDLADYALRSRTYFDKTKPKLLQSLPVRDGLSLHYPATAVAPSDPRILWAFSYGTTRLANAIDANGQLLWRSLDGGATWHIALPAKGPLPAKAGRTGGIQNMIAPELSVAPTNPHRLLLADTSRKTIGSGADEAWLVQTVPPEHVTLGNIQADCAGCLDATTCAASCQADKIQSPARPTARSPVPPACSTT